MDAFNPNYRPKPKQHRSSAEFVKAIQSGNKYVLSELITHLESEDGEKKEVGLKVLDALAPQSIAQPAKRIGITGAPGVGKSTFINALCIHLAQAGKKVAVLAVDPSSQKSKGSILGDKTRMADLTQLEHVFIRPSPAGSTLGGITPGTKESILACEYAGYDYILVETVGVGQSEYVASQVVDVMILLLQAGGGDDIQGIKRGIMEMADLYVINKDDGDMKSLVKKAKAFYSQAVGLFNPQAVSAGCILTASSLEQRGFETILEKISAFFPPVTNIDVVLSKRRDQDEIWLRNMKQAFLLKTIAQHPKFSALMSQGPNGQILRELEEFKSAVHKWLDHA